MYDFWNDDLINGWLFIVCIRYRWLYVVYMKVFHYHSFICVSVGWFASCFIICDWSKVNWTRVWIDLPEVHFDHCFSLNQKKFVIYQNMWFTLKCSQKYLLFLTFFIRPTVLLLSLCAKSRHYFSWITHYQLLD